MRTKKLKNKVVKKTTVIVNKRGLSGWLFYAIVFLLLALVSGILGLGIISGTSFVIAQWLAIIFLVLFITSTIAHTIKKA